MYDRCVVWCVGVCHPSPCIVEVPGSGCTTQVEEEAEQNSQEEVGLPLMVVVMMMMMILLNDEAH